MQELLFDLVLAEDGGLNYIGRRMMNKFLTLNVTEVYCCGHCGGLFSMARFDCKPCSRMTGSREENRDLGDRDLLAILPMTRDVSGLS